MIEMETVFTNGATLELSIVYLCTGAFQVDQYPPTIELQYILPEWILPPEGGMMPSVYSPLSGEGEWTLSGMGGGCGGVRLARTANRLDRRSGV